MTLWKWKPEIVCYTTSWHTIFLWICAKVPTYPSSLVSKWSTEQWSILALRAALDTKASSFQKALQMIVSKEHQLIYSTLLEAGGGKGAGFCPQHCALLYHHSSNGAKIAPLMDPPPVLHLMHNLVSPKKSLLLEQFGNGHPCHIFTQQTNWEVKKIQWQVWISEPRVNMETKTWHSQKERCYPHINKMSEIFSPTLMPLTLFERATTL